MSASVSWEELPFRLDQLRKHVAEAQWRYELVTSSEPAPEADPPVSHLSPLDILQEGPKGVLLIASAHIDHCYTFNYYNIP